ncbi:MAG: NAD(P)/FAD-dependent oxidoreductase [Opitutae bacterium]|nr:NAD(P)/FAD-dependent oxidoreductase [Opitutae bacterium]
MDQPATRIVIAGGGAAGFFAAIACAEALAAKPGPAARVFIYESTGYPLTKVRISGGGRCNVTNACTEPRLLVKNYPRGGRELIGPLHRWGPRETVEWFAARGVALRAEPDGRMFPVTDDSQTIIDCLQHAARAAGVEVITHHGIAAASRRPAGGFDLTLTSGGTVACDRLLIATGGNAASPGLAIARSLGHAIEPPVPSLFTFQFEDPRLGGLAGLAVERTVVRVVDTALREEGPLLITHWGVSGPAILRLSAWGARELAAREYRFKLRVNFAPPHTRDSLVKELAAVREKNPRKQVTTWCPVALPLRFWERLVAAAGLAPTAPWTTLSNAALGALAAQVTEAEFAVVGKSTNKEEFVTCGGVRLREVDFHTMQSKLCPGLHFAGEVLDIDGITGGFNFQAAWTTGWIAGQALADTGHAAPPASP